MDEIEVECFVYLIRYHYIINYKYSILLQNCNSLEEGLCLIPMKAMILL